MANHRIAVYGEAETCRLEAKELVGEEAICRLAHLAEGHVVAGNRLRIYVEAETHVEQRQEASPYASMGETPNQSIASLAAGTSCGVGVKVTWSHLEIASFVCEPVGIVSH